MLFSIAFVDDTDMVRISVANMIETLNPQFKVYQYLHGKDLQDRLPQQAYQPYIFLMDISMPIVNGYDATIWAKKAYPNTPVLAFTMSNNEAAMIKMYTCGANGFITKNVDPQTLFEAIEDVRMGHFYCNINTDYKIIKNVLYKNNIVIQPSANLTKQELQILRLLITEKSYKQIADELSVSKRTIENHKEHITNKINIYTRQGLMLYAIRLGLVQL